MSYYILTKYFKNTLQNTCIVIVFYLIFVSTKRDNKMTTSNFTIVKETEKAILYVVGFKFNENRPSIVYGVNGNENLNTGYLVECWFPKSVIDAEGVVADWFTKKVREAFGRFNPIMGDVIY